MHWVSFETPFFSSVKAKKASEKTNCIPLMVRKITPVYLAMMRSPSVKYGKNMNPCMDCHTLMFRLAGEIMTERGFDFLFSGEVLGQRPMSQTRTSLRYVEKHSGYDGTIVRPLSAKNLAGDPPGKTRTRGPGAVAGYFRPVPETAAATGRKIRGDRFSGAGRRVSADGQDFQPPAQGALFDHQADYPEKDLDLLKFGRHMRLDPKTKIVVGRTRQDNEQINHCIDPETDMVLKVDDFPGPVVVIPGGGSEPIPGDAGRRHLCRLQQGAEPNPGGGERADGSESPPGDGPGDSAGRD